MGDAGVFRTSSNAQRHSGVPFTVSPINWLSLCVPSKAVRGTDELPVKVRGGSEAVGRPAVARAVRAALGDAVQQLRRQLPPEPIGHAAEHHRAPIASTPGPERPQAPAAADRWGPAG